MKIFYLKQKSLLFMLVMLCMSFTATVENVNGVNIDGVFYNLLDSRWYDIYDANGNYQGGKYVSNVAIVTYNPETEVSNPGSVDTYQGDLTIPGKVTYNDTEYTVMEVNSYTFANSRSLTSVQFPSSVVQIGYGAFRYCTSPTQYKSWII